MEKPLIGLLAGRLSSKSNSCGRQFVNDNYMQAIIRTGGRPIILPICEDVDDQDAYIAMCDGILVPGGHDVNPLCYHEDPLPLQQESSLRYDHFQINMVQKAQAAGLPVLGICRGIQLMNVAAGGTLYQDISYQNREHLQMHQMKEADAGQAGHSIEIEEGSRLHDLFGDTILVNSFHHQCVKEPGEGYRVTARAKDGTIEAIERDGEPFCVGVQWHPEVMFEEYEGMRPLFAAFVEAAAQRR